MKITNIKLIFGSWWALINLAGAKLNFPPDNETIYIESVSEFSNCVIEGKDDSKLPITFDLPESAGNTFKGTWTGNKEH